MSLQKRVPIKFLLFAGSVIVLVLLPFLFKGYAFLTPGGIKDLLAGMGAIAPVGYMLIMAAVVATPIPSLPLNFAAGAVFGPFSGTLYSVIGATGGALISFFLARFLGREFIERFLKGHIHFCTPCSDRLLTTFVFLARLVPVFSFDLISYGAGLTKMSVRNFIAANFFGMLPLTFVYNYFGAAIVIRSGLSVVFGAVMVALFFLLPQWIERRNLFSLRKYFRHMQEEIPQKGEIAAKEGNEHHDR